MVRKRRGGKKVKARKRLERGGGKGQVEERGCLMSSKNI